MKKTKLIILDVCIVFLFSVSVLLLVMSIKGLSTSVPSLARDREWYQRLLSEGNPDPQVVSMVTNSIEFYKAYVTHYSIYTALGFLALAACAFLFVYCNPRLFRRSTWTNLSEEWAKNKEERNARKQAKSETDKQQKIAELEKELDELKNKTNSNP